MTSMAIFAIKGHVPCNLCVVLMRLISPFVCLFFYYYFFGLIKTDMISRTGNVNVRMPEMHKNCTQNNIVNVCTERFIYNCLYGGNRGNVHPVLKILLCGAKLRMREHCKSILSLFSSLL